MIDQHFLSPSTAPGVFGPLQGGERLMWHGRCGVAEYAFDQAASMPRWTLPENTVVMVTDRRVRYSHQAEDSSQVRSGELRWLWPQHLRVQPGARRGDRGAAATQIQLVCGGDDGTFPALVLAGGDLATVGDADRLANIMRQAIARFRVDNAKKLGLTTDQMRMLARLLMGPEFRNHQGGEGQTASLLGAMRVARPAPAAEVPAPATDLPAPATDLPASAPVAPARAADRPTADRPTADRPTADLPTADLPTADLPTADLPTADLPTADLLIVDMRVGGTPVADMPVADAHDGHRARLINYRPGRAADAARALLAARAEQESERAEPEIASRAADLAARVATMVSQETTPQPRPQGHAEPHPDDLGMEATADLGDRAEQIRRTGARLAANSARWKLEIRRETGLSTRGGQNR